MKTRILVLSGIFMILSACTSSAQKHFEVNSTDVAALLSKDPNVVVLDVRTAGEFNQGHIKGAINIDINQPDALNRINKLDKKASYLVYCRTKNRSGVAVNNMEQNGYKSIYQMMDGMNGWNMNGLPVEK